MKQASIISTLLLFCMAMFAPVMVLAGWSQSGGTLKTTYILYNKTPYTITNISNDVDGCEGYVDKRYTPSKISSGQSGTLYIEWVGSGNTVDAFCYKGLPNWWLIYQIGVLNFNTPGSGSQFKIKIPDQYLQDGSNPTPPSAQVTEDPDGLMKITITIVGKGDNVTWIDVRGDVVKPYLQNKTTVNIRNGKYHKGIYRYKIF